LLPLNGKKVTSRMIELLYIESRPTFNECEEEMKKNFGVSLTVLFAIGILLFLGCGDDPTEPDPLPHWQIVFEDNFDGDTINTTNWTQFHSTPAPYSLTGSGELEIEGESGDDEDGALFAYYTIISGNYVRVTTKFRTTQNDPVQDDAEFEIVLNADSALSNCYLLSLMSEPLEATRDYELRIVKYTNSVPTVLDSVSMGGTMPQISAGNDYILEGVNSNGTIALTIKNGNGTILKTLSIVDSTLSGGYIAFGGDLNIGTTGSQAIFFDYVKVEKYQ